MESPLAPTSTYVHRQRGVRLLRADFRRSHKQGIVTVSERGFPTADPIRIPPLLPRLQILGGLTLLCCGRPLQYNSWGLGRGRWSMGIAPCDFIRHCWQRRAQITTRMFKTAERAGAQNRLSLSLREPEEVYNYLESLYI